MARHPLFEIKPLEALLRNECIPAKEFALLSVTDAADINPETNQIQYRSRFNKYFFLSTHMLPHTAEAGQYVLSWQYKITIFHFQYNRFSGRVMIPAANMTGLYTIRSN